MFENLLFQEHIVDTLKREIADGSLPQSLLFYGEPFSGKLTTALELARVLNCELDGRWGCQCKSCKQNLTLEHPYLQITGSRYTMQEINQSAELLQSQKTRSSQFIFVRNVRKLIKRFSEDLWDSEDAKFKKANSSLNNIEEYLYLLEPERELPPDKKLASTIKKIVGDCTKLCNELPKGNIPINQIRNISTWVRQSSHGNKKVIILERAELMQESSRNSLLKILEEPPMDTYFILISNKKSTVLPTILSRVRAYAFKHRDSKEQQLIMGKLFGADEGFSYLKEYFLSFSEFEGDSLKVGVQEFLSECFKFNSSFNNAISLKIESSHFQNFLELLTNELKEMFFNPEESRLSLNQLEQINRSIRDKIVKQNHFNQNSMLLLETLFYEIKRILNA